MRAALSACCDRVRAFSFRSRQSAPWQQKFRRGELHAIGSKLAIIFCNPFFASAAVPAGSSGRLRLSWTCFRNVRVEQTFADPAPDLPLRGSAWKIDARVVPVSILVRRFRAFFYARLVVTASGASHVFRVLEERLELSVFAV